MDHDGILIPKIHGGHITEHSREKEESEENSDHGFRGSMYGAIGIAPVEGGHHSLEYGVSTE